MPCPKCGEKYFLWKDGETITCLECNAKFSYEEYKKPLRI